MFKVIAYNIKLTKTSLISLQVEYKGISMLMGIGFVNIEKNKEHPFIIGFDLYFIPIKLGFYFHSFKNWKYEGTEGVIKTKYNV